MAFQKIKNILIKGISACVPANQEKNIDLPLLNTRGEAVKFIESTGVESRHIVRGTNLCTSDLCFEAANNILQELKWSPTEVECLIFVSQTPDYILPATACILQNRLGLPTECFAMDISLGCSGWVYGLLTIASLITSGQFRKGLLLAGDTTSVTKSHKDKSTYPLFGDAGTATAIEYSQEASNIFFHTGTDGKGYEAIIIPDGGFRNFVNNDSFVEQEIEPGIIRNRLQSVLNGPAVFTFGISKAPRSVNALLDRYKISKEEIDYFVFHQANLFMNEKIRTKLKIEPGRVPYSLNKYGNTSSASIPLTIVSELRDVVSKEKKKILACAFGVGLSWASVYFETDRLVCPEVIKI